MSTAAPANPTKMKRVAAASLIGTTIEFYDFLIYGTAAALVFGPLFFPSLGESAGTWASVATFGVAFVFRPLGAVLFGHWGDRLGRKKTLVITLLMMGGATFAIGLVPTAAVLGAGAPPLLIALRAVQGVALGGEWAGAALLTTENADAKTRGRYSLYPQLGPGLGVVLSALTFLATSQLMSNEAFATWGWRVPFLGSAVLVVLGLWVRLAIEETPSFEAVTKNQEQVGFPFAQAMREQWKEILLGGGILSMSLGAFYLAIVFMGGFARTPEADGGLELSQTSVLLVNVVGGLVLCASVIGSAIASDRFGRRTVLLTGTLLGVVAGPVALWVVQPGSAASFAVAMAVLMLAIGIPYGPAAAYLPELFKARYRYTGAGVAYNLAGILGGALPLVVADPLVQRFGKYGLAWFVTALAITSTLCLLASRETRGVALDDTEPELAGAAR